MTSAPGEAWANDSDTIRKNTHCYRYVDSSWSVAWATSLIAAPANWSTLVDYWCNHTYKTHIGKQILKGHWHVYLRCSCYRTNRCVVTILAIMLTTRLYLGSNLVLKYTSFNLENLNDSFPSWKIALWCNKSTVTKPFYVAHLLPIFTDSLIGLITQWFLLKVHWAPIYSMPKSI